MFHCGWASVTLTLSPSIDLQTRQEGALGEIAQGPRKRTEEDPVYPVKPFLLSASPSAPSLQREEHLSWVWPGGQMIPGFCFSFHTALARAGRPHTLRNSDVCQGGVPADVIPLFLLPARLDVMDLLGTDSAVSSPFCQVCAEPPALAQCFKEDSNTSKSEIRL